jgi:UDP-glucose 4-epimerase
MKKVLVTGSQGFIGSYLCLELLNHGYSVVGIDNFSKYGFSSRPQDGHKNFSLISADMIDIEKSASFDDFKDVNCIIAGAAMIGGISYFHKYAYDLLATNERILASTFDLALRLFGSADLERIVVISSSMVFENTKIYPTPESEAGKCLTPDSTYGFQKLAVEYFCKGANEQHGLPYTIVRPFNCVGVGEDAALGEEEILSGNIKLMMSHVLPDLINKVLKGQNPLHVFGDGTQVRCYTNGRDIARGIRLAMESDAGINEDFNLSTPLATSVEELATLIWKSIFPGGELNLIYDEPYQYDVQKRIPDVTKAKRLLGFEAEISLEESVREVIQYMEKSRVMDSVDAGSH